MEEVWRIGNWDEGENRLEEEEGGRKGEGRGRGRKERKMKGKRRKGRTEDRS